MGKHYSSCTGDGWLHSAPPSPDTHNNNNFARSINSGIELETTVDWSFSSERIDYRQ